MPEIASLPPGHFCWIELATTDPGAAREFYTKLFGWSVREHDMGEGGSYFIFQKNEHDAAAMYRLMADQQRQGVPPNWASYVAVASADSTVGRVQSLGGTVLAPPFDVGDFGRMAVLQDPQGAVFCIWEAKQHIGVTIRDEADTLCWNELAASDAPAALEFYSKLFGWTGKVSPEYIELSVNGTAIGGIRALQPGEHMPPNWMPYFAVTECDSATARAQEGGAKAYVPPMDIPNVGRFSVVADPQGAVFAMIQLTGHP